LGVYGMHTLGHLEGGHGQAGGHGMTVAQEMVVPAGAPGFVPDRKMPGFDPTSVCLAVLTALMLVMVMAAWIRIRRRTGGGSRSLSWVRQVARPPPQATAERLAGLSLLRI
jgi:hypothetical protein